VGHPGRPQPETHPWRRPWNRNGGIVTESKATDMAAIHKAILEQETSLMSLVKGDPKTGEMIGLRIRTTDGWLIVATKGGGSSA
jgi:hypothetical protein